MTFRTLKTALGSLIPVLLSAAETSSHPLASSHVDASTNAPSLGIVRDGTQLAITFSGVLQSAETIVGPWTTLTNVVPPFRLQSAGVGQYFRSSAALPVSVFSYRSVVTLTVTGPLQKHFELAFAGTPDGIFPPRREKPYFDGTITLGAFQLPATLRVRGNSSLQECPFPKLKLKISAEHRRGTPFYDAREIKIGTHCADGGHGNVGRLRDEIATYREALAYETMELLGFPSPRVRRAQIEYHDTTLTNVSETTGWTLSRQALIFDDVEVVASRLGGRALSDDELVKVSGTALGTQVVTDLRLLHALLGNWDFTLPLDGPGLWNTDVVEFPDKSLLPLAGDFDLASWVTGEVRLRAPQDYRPDLPPLEREARYAVEQVHQSVGSPVFQAASARFIAKRSAAESLIASASLDEAGRGNAQRHVAAFFDALASVEEVHEGPGPK